jgi:NADH-quinone oxidoreductase subunit F
MESLEGKRGIPRIRPPFPAVVGLYGGPTIINNAETLATVPHIFRIGGAEYAKIGTERNGGTRLFCLSGNVAKPGVYELPMGYNLKKMIYEVGGGIPGRQVAQSRGSRRILHPRASAPTKSISAWTSTR